MLKLPLFILLLIFFTSCSSNLALKHFNKNELETKAILYTKKTDLLDKNEHKLIFWATYLNPLEIKGFSRNKEYFLISTYFTKEENQDLLNKNYKLTLNGRNSLNIKEITDERLLSNKTPWGKEYLISFKRYKSEKKLELKLEDNSSNSTLISFEK